MKHCTHCGIELSGDALFCLKCGQSQVAAGEDTVLGTVVAERYLVKARVGSGSSGTVYDVRHVTLQQRMALKLLHHHLCQDPVAVERFRREATTVTHLDHPHIIGVRDFGTAEDGRLFLAMEFLEGRTLAEVLKEDAPLTVPRTLDIVAQVVDALGEAHQSGYVHRDLRPRNLFLTTRRGRSDFVKVMDFGLAKLMLHELEPGQATVGISFGDPAYLSPEQASGETADRRTDVYALGVIVYEMLTGVPPLVGDDVFATINMHLRVRPEPPSQKRRSLPKAFDAPILKALAKKAAERFETVEAFQDAMVQAAASTTAPGLGISSGKKRRDQTEPAIPSKIRESGELPATDPLDPNKTALGLGPVVSLPPTASGVSSKAGSGQLGKEHAASVKPEALSSHGSADPPQSSVKEEVDPKPASAADRLEPASAAQSSLRPLLAERPDGSGPHPVLGGAKGKDGAKGRDGARGSKDSSLGDGAAVVDGEKAGDGGSAGDPIRVGDRAADSADPTDGPTGLGAPARADAEVPDPTMSQMWYSAGEAEAAEAMAEYEEHLREAGDRQADLTEPVLFTAGGVGEVHVGRSRATLALVFLAVALAAVVVVVVLLSRHSRSPGDRPGGKSPDGLTQDPSGSKAADAWIPDGSIGAAPDAGSKARRDARAVIVVDMAVQIDAPEPGRARPPGPRPVGRPMADPGRIPGRPEPAMSKGSEAGEAVAAGRRALARGDTTGAQLEFQRALTLQPGHPQALAGLGEVDFEVGQYARAASRLRAAVRGMPSSVKTWVLLGNAQFRSGRYKEARDAFRTALRLSPGHAEAKRNLELVERRLGSGP